MMIRGNCIWKMFYYSLKRQQFSKMPLFEQKVQEIAAFTSQIKKLQSQLDDEVFAIYGIDSAAADLIHSENGY